MSVALFISAYYPSDQIPAAGNKLSATSLRDACDRFDHVYAVSFLNSAEERAKAELEKRPNLTEITYRVALPQRLKAAVRYPNLPAGAAVRRLLALGTVEELLRTHDISHILIEFTQGLGAVPIWALPMTNVRVHDIMFQLYERQAALGGMRGLLAWLELLKVRSWEKTVLSQCKIVSTLTEKDAEILSTKYRLYSVDVVAPTEFYRITGRSDKTIIPHSMMFWANFARKENSDAAWYFVKEILPIIQEHVPDARVRMVGANPPSWSSKRFSGVEWTGFVGSPDDYFRACHVGVIPLRSGAGIKIKALEYIAAGIPTVSTSVGAEGVGESPLLTVVDDSNRFALACIELMSVGQEKQK